MLSQNDILEDIVHRGRIETKLIYTIQSCRTKHHIDSAIQWIRGLYDRGVLNRAAAYTLGLLLREHPACSNPDSSYTFGSFRDEYRQPGGRSGCCGKRRQDLTFYDRISFASDILNTPRR